MLKETFLELTRKYVASDLPNDLWTEIEENYSSRKRHYHTLTHLENLLTQLLGVKKEIQDWDALLFAMFYHDVIYLPLKSDNEEKSAELAEKRMVEMSIPPETIQLCIQHILATKTHPYSANSDTNYFIDSDLSILGQNWEAYLSYNKNVRKEYSLYPDFLYNPGRKKVLKHFLSMPRIFKTDFFFDKFERSARENLQKEFDNIS